MSENILDRFKNVQAETVIDTSRKVRVGIIGCGWIAEAHVLSYLAQPDVEIVAAADLTEEAVSSDADTDSYEQTAYYKWDGSADVLYVVVLRDMTQAQ